MVAVKEIAKFSGADVRGMRDEDFVKRYPGVPRATGPGGIVCCAMPYSEELLVKNINPDGLYMLPPWFKAIHGLSHVNGSLYAEYLSSQRFLLVYDMFCNQWSHEFVVNLGGVRVHDSRVDEPKKFRLKKTDD